MKSKEVLWLRCGELVEVRTLPEILETLDEKGTLDNLPFMPEMLPYCGKRFTVYKRSDRTCCPPYKARGMNNTVWLENARCDGSAHDGCAARCAFFWKEAWLKRIRPDDSQSPPAQDPSVAQLPGKTRDDSTGKYLCQATLLADATFPLGLWGNARSYLLDLRYGNLTVIEFLKTIYYWARAKVPIKTKGQKCGPIYGTLKKTPSETLNLRPGELVEIKSPAEIAATLNAQSLNRGMGFQPDMLEFCGRRYRVLDRPSNIINETNGEMFKANNTVLLDGAVCNGVCRRGCGRRGYYYWREIWLKRVQQDAVA